jgi:hypothetical protein
VKLETVLVGIDLLKQRSFGVHYSWCPSVENRRSKETLGLVHGISRFFGSIPRITADVDE